MVHSNDDAQNKIPLKSATGLDDEEKNGGEFIHDTTAAEEARREQMRANLLKWMKKLTIVLICFIGIALISYVIISLCFSDWPKTSSTASTNATSNSSLSLDDNANGNGNGNATVDPSNATSSTIRLNPTQTASLAGGIINNKHGDHNANGNGADGTPAVPTEFDNLFAETSPMPAPQIDVGSVAAPVPVAVSSASSTIKPLVALDAALVQDAPYTDTQFDSKLGVYEQAAVCSDKEVCSRIGRNVLQQGGSAVDAAIATLLCNGIVTMQSMGVGGGMLMNVYIKEKQHAYAIDAREVAPFAAFAEMFDSNLNLSLHGGLSIAVPGELMGYHRAHERFGKLPWQALVEPSIKLCHEGFYLSQHQWNAMQYKWKYMKNNTVLTNTFVNATTGKAHPVGTKLQPPKELCETYMLIAKNGPMDFYNGTLAKLVIEDLQDLGSGITNGDLEAYQADLVSSITMQLGDDILYALPPISSGTVVANILSVLEGFNFSKADMMGVENEARTIHRFAEAMKFAFAKRWELGDVRFNDVRELVSKLTNPEYSIDIRAQINDSSVLKEIYDYGAQFMGVDDVGTSQTVILAPNGDAVSVTSSVNDFFGSGQAGKRTGILFNSGMNDFSVAGKSNQFGLPPAPTNLIEPRKRPMSSMSPMILADQKGNVRLVLGAAGGSKIISAIVEVVARVLWFGEDIKTAIDAPRFHHQLVPNVLEYQKGTYSEELLKLIQAKGHQVKPYMGPGSVVCGIVRNDTAIYANADYRKRGGIAGY